MDKTDEKFIGQHKDETVLFCWRRHAFILLADFLKFLFFFLVATIAFSALFYFKENIEKNIFILLFSISNILLLHSFHYIFFNLLNFLASPVLLTKERVIKVRTKLFLSAKLEMIYINEIQDIYYEKHGLIKNLLDFGTIHITSSSIGQPFKISCMPSPIDKLTNINNQKALILKKAPIIKDRRSTPRKGTSTKS